MKKIVNTIMDWLFLSRVPFLSVGVMPFVLGAVMGYRQTGIFFWPVFWLGGVAIVLVLLATYYNGEVHDIVEDRLAAQAGSTFFAGGSQVLLKGRTNAKVVERAAYASVLAAMAIGLILQFIFKTGIWTIPLGLTGMIAGFFYSKPPLRLVKRGIGEILIAYSYGWLPIAVGFYLQTQHFDRMVLLVSFPVALTIFDVILINEFLDYTADVKAGKTNLLVRRGKAQGAVIYGVTNTAAIVTFLFSVVLGAPVKAIGFYAVVVGLTVVAIAMVIGKKYESRNALQVICALSILVNLMTTTSYTIGFLAQ